MPLVFIFVAVLFWLTVMTIFAVGRLLRMMFHVFAAPVGGARALVYRSRDSARS
jgi:hypothetical protein